MSVFSNSLLGGNLAAITILETDDFNNDKLLKKVATTIGLSEVSFINFDNSSCSIRWFSPKVEVDLCGHGTIGACSILFQRYGLFKDNFYLIKSKQYDLFGKACSHNRVQIKIPIIKIENNFEANLDEIMQASLIESSSFTDVDCIVRVKNIEVLKSISINFNKLLLLNKRGLIVTCLSEDRKDLLYRYFCPRLGFNEDPGTGSALSSLYSFWEHEIDFNKRVNFYQESFRRSKGLVFKDKIEQNLIIDTEVSAYFTRRLEID
ncbi:MAG: PhzF family phenazine biosynthesis isomerase [Thermodesulfobacteriota bacteirum]|nr:PhzF family phenazine biosynthesis isomerase [Thermodesulfobacteriota bacterium]